MDRAQRVRERERTNGASGKRCDTDAATRRSQTENWEIRVNQSKPTCTRIPRESETHNVTQIRSRREWSRWESSDIDEARRVSERERTNGASGKRCDID